MPAFTTMSSNWFTSVSRPAARTLSWYIWSTEDGSAPTAPAATCTFCSRSALVTSPAVSPRPASLFGSSHSRIANRRSPKMMTSATPGTRFSASRT